MVFYICCNIFVYVCIILGRCGYNIRLLFLVALWELCVTVLGSRRAAMLGEWLHPSSVLVLVAVLIAGCTLISPGWFCPLTYSLMPNTTVVMSLEWWKQGPCIKSSLPPSFSLSSMYFDEDGDLAHEFYLEERVVLKSGVVRWVMRRTFRNLTPQVKCIYLVLRINCVVCYSGYFAFNSDNFTSGSGRWRRFTDWNVQSQMWICCYWKLNNSNNQLKKVHRLKRLKADVKSLLLKANSQYGS